MWGARGAVLEGTPGTSVSGGLAVWAGMRREHWRDLDWEGALGRGAAGPMWVGGCTGQQRHSDGLGVASSWLRVLHGT